MGGQTFIEVNYNTAWVNEKLAGVQAYDWLFQWGMYIFLLVTVAICFWIFFDSIVKKKGQKALVPRMLSIIGIFAVIPAFIFRFTGQADGTFNLVRLNAEAGTPYYQGPIYWNVKWLVAGYGPTIALIALIAVVISIVAFVIYASTVNRSRPSTEFVGALNNKFSELERQVNSVKQESNASSATLSAAVQSTGSSSNAATVFDRKPQAATIIDQPKSGASLLVVKGTNSSANYDLPQSDMKIGRGTTNDIILDDGKSSREHARLLYNNNNWLVLDLGSANGTFVNDVRVNSQQALNNGDVIRIGDTQFRFTSA